MDTFVFLSSFIYRIRYKLFFGTTFIVIAVAFLTNFLPKTYVVTTTLFTGITSKTSIDDGSGGMDWNSSNNAHDNIINLVKSRSVLEMVSVNLIAQALIKGDLNAKESPYISAKNYRDLLKIAQDVLPLVDKTSQENTVRNLLNYKKESKNNFIYAIFNWEYRHYSYQALSKIKVGRKGVSDMIEISYECDDPGVASNTLAFLNKELASKYELLLLSASNDVVKHFEQQLIIARTKLNESEDKLVSFNIENKIINYEEQTKHLSALNNSFESHYEEILLTFQSSKALLVELEKQMDIRTQLVRENETFLDALTDISKLNGKIAEIEIFGDSTSNNDESLERSKAELTQSEQKIKSIANNIDLYKFSKKGVVITEMVNEWFDALLKYEKSRSELLVMEKRKNEIIKQYETFSPVGPNLARYDREVRVNEEEYLTILHHLGLAKLKQKNIMLESGTLQVVTPPDLPLIAMSRKRELYVILAFICAIVFILGYNLLIEMLDRTIRDGQRAAYLTKGKVIGAFPSNNERKYRNYIEECKRISISYLSNILNRYIKNDKPLIINLLSIKQGEGKSFIADELKDYWEERGYNFASISYHKEFDNESKIFRRASSIFNFLDKYEWKSDIITVEYEPLAQSSVPPTFLKEATINLLILDAQRAWTPSDKSIFENLQTAIGKEETDHPLLIYLNNASRETVEQYTGMLPPYTTLRKLNYKIFNFGITAKK
ncbi:MAG: hypothetical protein RR277_01300 [Rikenellaceae bacterium]